MTYFCADGKHHHKSELPANVRPLLGDGVQEMAPAIGTAFLDSTTCDVYLVNEAGKVVGRPILTAAVDVNTSLCLGYSLSWEGGIYSLGHLMLNILADKVDLCRKLGVKIDEKQWPSRGVLPGEMITDRGSEYMGDTFEQIAELGVTIVNLPAFRAELKGGVERFFGLVQGLYTTILKGRGTVMPDFQKRGATDYRKEATLTMADFEKVVARCIVYYNAERVVKNYPYTKEMLDEKVAPHAADIWRYLNTAEANLIPVTVKEVALTLLPRTEGKFSRNGLKVNKLRYKADGYTEQYLTGGTAIVAYDPENVGKVWLKEKDGSFVEFRLIEGRFGDMTINEAADVMKRRKSLVRDCGEEEERAKVELYDFVETVAAGKHKRGTTAAVKNIRKTRNSEIRKTHKSLGEYLYEDEDA